MTTGMRRSKAMPTDGPTAKFLYAIIKQLDLKSVCILSLTLVLTYTDIRQIDWNSVAAQMEISNGHAARMRYSRFRQQMEGTTSTPRGSRPRKNANKCDKGGNVKAGWKEDPGSPHPVMKQENGTMVKQEGGFGPSQQNPMPKNDPYSPNVPNLADIPLAPQPMIPAQSLPSSIMSYPSMTMPRVDLGTQPSLPPFSPSLHGGFERQNSHHVWAPVKLEQEDASRLGDVLVKVETPERR